MADPTTSGRADLAPALVAGVVAAALGAAGWALMVIETDHSYGFGAIGLGLLAGTLVSRAVGGRRAVSLVVIGLGSLLVALAVGKYAAFAYEIHRYAQARYGSAGAAAFGYLSANTWDAFRLDLSQQFSGFYLLWVGIGGISVWRALSPVGRIDRGARAARAAASAPRSR